MKNLFGRSCMAVMSLIFVTGLFGCAPRIDGSSDEAFTASLEKMREGLDEEKKDKFGAALLVIAFSEGNDGMRSRIDGKTVDGVIEIAEKVGREKDIEFLEKKIADAPKNLEEDIKYIRERIDRYTADLKKAEAAKAESAADKELMRQFIITDSKIRIVNDYFMKRVNIMCKVSNTSSFAIKSIYMNGKLQTPGRSVPWHEGGIRISLSGGLEPGEAKPLSVEPNLMSGWSNIGEIPDGAVLDLEVTGFERADGSEVEISDADFDGIIADLNKKIADENAEIEKKKQENIKSVAEWREKLKKAKDA